MNPPSPTRGAKGASVPRLVACLLASWATTACSDVPRSVAEGVGTPTVLSSSDVHVVGTSESLAEVQDLEVLADGGVRVLNSLEPFFLGFGPDGDLRDAYGSEGGGPEEFRLPTSFVTGTADDWPWVFDLRRHALVRISGPDEEWAEISLASDSVPPGSVMGGMNMMGTTVRTARLGDEIVLPRTIGSTDAGIAAFRMQLLRPDLVALDPSTGSVRKIVGLAEVMDDAVAGFERTAGAFPLWYRLWAVCGDDRIHVHDRVRNEIRTFAADGTELDPIPLPSVPFTEVTTRQFALAIFPLRLAELQGRVGGDVTPADSVNLLNEMAEAIEGTPAQLAAWWRGSSSPEANDRLLHPTWRESR